MLKKLSADDWIDAGLKSLARDGFTALKADVIARKLKVSRGSFYWHFADVAAFHRAVLERWRELALKNVIADIDPLGRDRAEALVRRAFGTPPQLEVAVRAWATVDETARAVVRSVDAERVAYMRKMLIEEGVAPAAARARANIMNWTYLGFALSAGKTHPKLDDVVTELVAFALPS